MNTLCVDYDIYLKSIAWIGYDEKHYFISTSLQQFHSHNILISLYNLEVRVRRRNLQISESCLLYSSQNYKPKIEKQNIEEEKKWKITEIWHKILKIGWYNWFRSNIHSVTAKPAFNALNVFHLF